MNLTTAPPPRHSMGGAVRVMTLLFTAVLGTLALLGASLTAAAAQNGNGSETGNITQSEGSLTIHKFEEPEAGGEDHDGRELDRGELGYTPLAGVQFTVAPVRNIDLTTDDGWAVVENLEPGDVGEGTNYPLGQAQSQRTNQQGTTTFGELPVGVYLVTETDFGGNQIAHPTQPFLVTIPAPVDGEWLYDVHAYPKNSVIDIDKTVDDSDAYAIGDEVTWSVQPTVPHLPAGESFDSYRITDELDPRLSYSSHSLRLGGERVPGEYYEFERSGPQGRNLEISFTSSGLGFLADNQGATLTWNIVAEVVSNTDGNGVIDNTAIVHVNDWDYSAEADTEWGALQIVKHSENGTSDRLEGATFEVYVGDSSGPNGRALSVGGQTEFTTNEDGEVVIEGLRVLSGNEYYWLVETEAPAGYQSAGPYGPITIEAGSTVNIPASNIFEVENEQVPGFELPLTGGLGSLPFIIAGLLLVATALVVARVRRRHLAQAAAAARG